MIIRNVNVNDTIHIYSGITSGSRAREYAPLTWREISDGNRLPLGNVQPQECTLYKGSNVM